jgi:hypothetical protein
MGRGADNADLADPLDAERIAVVWLVVTNDIIRRESSKFPFSLARATFWGR